MKSDAAHPQSTNTGVMRTLAQRVLNRRTLGLTLVLVVASAIMIAIVQYSWGWFHHSGTLPFPELPPASPNESPSSQPPPWSIMGITFAFIDPRDPENVQLNLKDVPAFPFYLATTETTRAQFRTFVKATGYSNPGLAQFLSEPEEREDHSMGVVPFEAADRFCKWLGELDPGNRNYYRLPTVSEWRAAASRLTTSLRAAPDDIPKFAWCRENSNGAPQRVRTRSPSNIGIFDLYGNVREWCVDSLDKAASGNAPFHAVLLGGSFRSASSELLQADSADANLQSVPTDDCGFRVVLQTSEQTDILLAMRPAKGSSFGCKAGKTVTGQALTGGQNPLQLNPIRYDGLPQDGIGW